jgi:hypothetical protein
MLRLFSDAAAMKAQGNAHESGSRVSGSAGSTGVDWNISKQADLLKRLGVSDYNKCSKARALELNKKLAKFFHCNALPFNLVESEELADIVNALCPTYYKHGLPCRFWMAATGVDLIHKDVHEEVENHLQSCDALMANMDGWENEKI